MCKSIWVVGRLGLRMDANVNLEFKLWFLDLVGYLLLHSGEIGWQEMVLFLGRE